ncbi:tyrosine-type recombinase/integrase [Actinoplanes sp. GCM10030250]|uniref:tyrosine-type recombinase/integrase n=1 Tax=Actinoplanes sp. GCM10030250 TaxID=3273376 RepID=UPI00360CF9D8
MSHSDDGSPSESHADPNEANIALVNSLMAKLNVTPDQLTRGGIILNQQVPTFAEYIPQVRTAVTAGTLRAYNTYWQRILAQWGDRRLNEPTPTDIKEFAQRAREQAVKRRNSRGGGSAAEHLIAALRCVYHHAINDRLIGANDNPAARVRKPRRQPSLREALPERAVADIVRVTAETGNDPALDLLILRLHLETACRQGGALHARRHDLDTEQCLLRLHEKGQTQRWQPISPTLTTGLIAHFNQRADGDPASQLLRYRNGRPVGKRRYDNLWKRIRSQLPWADVHLISAHWLRHTTLTWGRTALRPGDCPALRRPHRLQPLRDHQHLHQSHPERSRTSTVRAHRRSAPTGHGRTDDSDADRPVLNTPESRQNTQGSTQQSS